MFINLIFLIMLALLVFTAVKFKISQQQNRRDFNKIPDEIKISPFSKALAELVAIAGGIYISLSMLTSFLSLSIPERIQLAENLQIDPLALLALVITIIQPVVFRLLKNYI